MPGEDLASLPDGAICFDSSETALKFALHTQYIPPFGSSHQCWKRFTHILVWNSCIDCRSCQNTIPFQKKSSIVVPTSKNCPSSDAVKVERDCSKPTSAFFVPRHERSCRQPIIQPLVCRSSGEKKKAADPVCLWNNRHFPRAYREHNSPNPEKRTTGHFFHPRHCTRVECFFHTLSLSLSLYIYIQRLLALETEPKTEQNITELVDS